MSLSGRLRPEWPAPVLVLPTLPVGADVTSRMCSLGRFPFLSSKRHRRMIFFKVSQSTLCFELEPIISRWDYRSPSQTRHWQLFMGNWTPCTYGGRLTMLSSQRQERRTVCDFPESRFSSQLIFIEHLNQSGSPFELPSTWHLDCVAVSCREVGKGKHQVPTTGLRFLPKYEQMERWHYLSKMLV